MKRFYTVLLAGVMIVISCATANAQNGKTKTSDKKSSVLGFLGDVIGSITEGNGAVSEEDFIGEWSYDGVSCILESEDILAQLGGAYAAQQVEGKLNEYLAKLGVKSGVCSCVLNEDKTCIVEFGSYQTSGTYEIRPSSNEIVLSFLYGQLNVTTDYVISGNTLDVVFDADIVLSLTRKAISLTTSGADSSNALSTLGVFSTLLEPFDGLKLGLKLKR